MGYRYQRTGQRRNREPQPRLNQEDTRQALQQYRPQQIDLDDLWAILPREGETSTTKILETKVKACARKLKLKLKGRKSQQELRQWNLTLNLLVSRILHEEDQRRRNHQPQPVASTDIIPTPSFREEDWGDEGYPKDLGDEAGYPRDEWGASPKRRHGSRRKKRRTTPSKQLLLSGLRTDDDQDA